MGTLGYTYILYGYMEPWVFGQLEIRAVKVRDLNQGMYQPLIRI